MKKIKCLALVLVLMLGLIGGAYAYWQETLMVDGTVNTGKFDVKITRAEVPNVGRADRDMEYIEGEAEIVDDGQKAIFYIGNLYPRPRLGYQNFQIYITNTGSVPAKLRDVTFNKDSGIEEVWENLMVRVSILIYDQEGNELWSNGYGKAKLEDLDLAIKTAMGDRVLNPGEVVTIGEPQDGEIMRNSIQYWLNPEAGNETAGQEVKFSMDFNWIQWNAP